MTTLWFETALLPAGWAPRVRCTLADGRLARVERDVPAADGDERHAIGLPGLPNVHSHAFQRAMAGLAETRGPAHDSFWTWREVMYRFVDRLSPDDAEAIAAQAYVEMLETGFTRVGEFHYLHNDPGGRPYAAPAEMSERIGAAAAETGIALTLLPCFYAHANFGGVPPVHGQRRFVTSLDGFAGIVDACRGVVRGLEAGRLGLAPHSLRAVTPAELAAVLALDPSAPVHIHAAEQVKEVEDSVAWSGARPVEWLLGHAGVDARWCLIHATHTTGAELARLAATGAVVGLCPETEGSLGDGIFGAPAWLEAGGRFAVGTDSNIRIDPAGELRLLEYVQRLALRSRNVVARGEGSSTGRTLFDGALEGGSRALAAGTPGLETGAAADIVTLDATHPSLAGRTGDALLDGWIFAAGRAAVDSVWRAGVRLVTHGRHERREAIARRYAHVLHRVLAS